MPLDVHQAQASLAYHLMRHEKRDIVTLTCTGYGVHPAHARQSFFFEEGDGSLWNVYTDNGEVKKVEEGVTPTNPA